MALFDRFRRPEARRGPVPVGWLLNEDKGGVLYGAPERMRSADTAKTHGKSAARCPAIIGLEARYFVIRCPFDMVLRFHRDPAGKPGLRNMLGDASPVRPKMLGQLVSLTAEAEWRYPDRPTLQIKTPYIFVADEPVWMSQVPPFFHLTTWPGTLFGGRFPIHIWPRPIMWAFEWHDISRDLSLKRGEPWFMLQFETLPADRPVQMVEAERTPALEAHMTHIQGAVNYVNQTFSLFKDAQARRPRVLLTPRRPV